VAGDGAVAAVGGLCEAETCEDAFTSP